MSSPPGLVYDERYVVPYPRQPHLEVLPHGINAGLVEGQNSPRVVAAGGLDVVPVAGLVWTELLRVSRKGWRESVTNENGRYDESDDDQGPITVAAALARRDQRTGQASRVVAVADTELFEDGFMTPGSSNVQFVRNATRWLTGRPVLNSRPLRSSRPVVMSDAELRVVQFALLGPYPLFWLMLGGLVRHRRRGP